jgi:hypothetical protein
MAIATGDAGHQPSYTEYRAPSVRGCKSYCGAPRKRGVSGPSQAVSMNRILAAISAIGALACSIGTTPPKPGFNLTGNWVSTRVCATTQASITQRRDTLHLLDTVDSTCRLTGFAGKDTGMLVGDSVWFGVSTGATFNGRVVDDSTIVGSFGPDTTSFHRYTP